MSLQLVYGSSVSKRKERIQEVLVQEAEKNSEKEYIVIVPEQASVSVQASLIKRHPKHALSNIDVLTFSRLAYKILEECHVKVNDPLEEMGKQILMRLALEKNRKNLNVLERSAQKEGFIGELHHLIAEFVLHGVTVEELRREGEHLKDHTLLFGKLNEVADIYETYLKLLHEKHELAEDRLQKSANLLGEWLKNKSLTVVFEDFTGFTGPQYQVIQNLLKESCNLVFSVVIGHGETTEDNKDTGDLFYMGSSMAEQLKEFAIRNRVEYKETYIQDEDEHFSKEILHIEKGLFVYPKKEYKEKPEHVRMVRCENPKEETTFVIHEIMKDIRSGLRYKDVAIVTGDPGLYKYEIKEHLEEAKLPYFLDEGVEVDSNPGIRLLESLLTIFQEDYSFESMMDYLKNPIIQQFIKEKSGLSTNEAHISTWEVENFALMHGFRRKAQWKTLAQGKDPLQITKLFELQEKMKRESVAVRVEALTEFLETLGVQRVLDELSKEDPIQNGIFNKTYETIEKLLQFLSDILGEQKMSIAAFADVLKTGLKTVRIKEIPYSTDRIIVGDLQRTRLSEIKKLYVLGANDKVLPPLKLEGGLLTDGERELLKQNHLELSETAKEEGFNNRFYLYRLFTKPTEDLCISFSVKDSVEQSILPSYVVGYIQNIFPMLVIENFSKKLEDQITTGKRGLDLFSENLRKHVDQGESEELTDSMKDALQFFHTREEEGLIQVAQGCTYHYAGESLKKETAKRLLGDHIFCSVSRIENFATCPFKHFASYELNLKERKVFELDARDYGNLYHDGLQKFFSILEKSGKQFRYMQESELQETIQLSVEMLVSDENSIFKSSNRNQYVLKRLERVLNCTVQVLQKHWQAGSFEKIKTEIGFGKNENLSGMQIPLGDGTVLHLEGRVDRVDIKNNFDRIVFQIIDYKSGDKNLDYTRINAGLDLQLPIYMIGVREALEQEYKDKATEPAGIYYYHIQDPILDENKNREKEMMLKGLSNQDLELLECTDKGYEESTVVRGLTYSEDKKFGRYSKVATLGEMEDLGRFAKEIARDFANRIVEGDVQVNPYEQGDKNGCTYCPYAGVCGFDKQIQGYKTRKLEKCSLDNIVHRDEEE